MSKGNTTETDVLALLFNATALSWNANGSVYISLHTADPGEAGTQLTSEATYTSYARVAVLRTSGGWTVSGATASNAALIQFPQCTGGTNTITYVAIGTVTTGGAGQVIYSGLLNSSLAVSNLIQPQFAIGALTITED
jgi:hypothetical protein